MLENHIARLQTGAKSGHIRSVSQVVTVSLSEIAHLTTHEEFEEIDLRRAIQSSRGRERPPDGSRGHEWSAVDYRKPSAGHHS